MFQNSKKCIDGTCMNSGSNSARSIIAAYEQDLVNRGLKPHTRFGAVSCVREYLERLTASGLDPFSVTPATITDYHRYLASRPNHRLGGRLSPRSVEIHLTSVRSLYAFLERSGRIDVNPASCLRVRRAASFERSALTRADIEQLRGASLDPLDRGLLAVFYGCGLRRSEGEALNVGDVDLHVALLHVRSGKGGRPRSVPMSEGVVRDLTPLVRCFRPPGEPALFVHRRGGRMRAATIYRRVKSMASRAEITSDVTLHGLRHAVATHLLEAGLTLEQTRDFLGHRDIGATKLYTHIKPAEPAS